MRAGTETCPAGGGCAGVVTWLSGRPLPGPRLIRRVGPCAGPS